MAKIYLVGGAVRDELLSREVTDRDWVVVGADPQTMIDQGFSPIGKDFPVFLHPKTKEEYALARTERKVAAGYGGFQFYTDPTVTLEQDLARRDLTINAIAKSEQGELKDPFNGVADIKAKLLRHVSQAFAEDPLRVLRTARFAARFHHLGFSIAEPTLKLMQQIVASGEMSALTPERVFTETEKALSEQDPQIYFEVLKQVGALAVVFPEIEKLWGIPNPPLWHPEIDSGIHTMMVLKQAAILSFDPKIRFAALCHDLGKTLTPQTLWPSHHGHEKAGVKVIKELCLRIKAPKKWMQLAIITSEFHLHIHRLLELKPSTIIKMFERIGAYKEPQICQQFLMACEADFRGRTGFEKKNYPQHQKALDILHLTQKVDSSPWREKGISGIALGLKIHQHRVALAKQCLHQSMQINREDR